MSDYTQITDFSAKDSLTTGDPEKVILGSDVDAELAAIATAIATKFDTGNDGAGSGLDADNVDGVGPFAATTYTPTLTLGTNAAAATLHAAFYIRAGSIVVVFVSLDLDPTTGGSATTLGISLPVASNIGSVNDAIGIVYDASGPSIGYIVGDSANDRASLGIIPSGSTNAACSIIFGYRVI